MKESFGPTSIIAKDLDPSPKQYPKTSMKELRELDAQGTPEDWLNFFKRYDLIPQETSSGLLKTQPVAIQRTDITKSFVGGTFFKFVREEWKGDWKKIEEKIPHISVIKKKEDHPKSYWENITAEQFIEELSKRGVDFDHIPPIIELQHIAKITRWRPDLRKIYNQLRAQNKDCGKIQLPRIHYQDLQELAQELIKDLEQKGATIEELLQNKKNLKRLGLSPRWFGRIQGYGGRTKFYEDLGKLFDIKSVIKEQTLRNYYLKLDSTAWQEKLKESGIDINSPIKHSEIYNKMSRGVVRFIRKVGKAEFEKIADIKFLEEKPSGWFSACCLLDELRKIGISPNLESIKTIAEELKTKHLQPEWSRHYVGTTGHYIDHYSPELVEEIIKFFEQRHRTNVMIDSTEPNKWLNDLLKQDAQGENDNHTENVTE